MGKSRFSGVFTPIPTPFDNDGSVNYNAFQDNLKTWNTWNLDGLVVNGTAGEFLHTTMEEQIQLVKIAKESTMKPVLACVRDEGTAAAISSCKKMAEAGADAVLVLVPFYWRKALTPEVLIRHFQTIANESLIPVLLYSNPPSTQFELDYDVVLTLADHPNIVGMKDSTADIVKLGRLAQATKDKDFSVLTGQDTLLLSTRVIGCSGGIVGMSSSIGPIYRKLMDYIVVLDYENAAVLQHKIMDLAAVVTSLPVIPALKALMDIAGLYGGPPRAPLLPIDSDGRAKLTEAVRSSEVLQEAIPFAVKTDPS